ncbi:Ger(x)C family spore germination protein [Pontibacillus salipaludis]|uniref:Ger(x)C family spore germination protein n=1 Tax=Pontibacillus salipaludis TaxID=1697394 RepID=UPI0031E7E4D0
MKKLICILCVLFLLTGCVERKYIERLGIITVIGYDLLEEGFLEGTLIFFQFDPNANSVSQIITSRANSAKGIRQDANLKSSKQLVSGQLRLAVFGSKLAEKGIMRVADTMARDAAVSDLLYMTIAEEDAKAILSSNKMEDAADIGNYLNSMIRKNIRNEVLPYSTLHKFQHDYYDFGRDPILPMLNLEDGKPVLRHLALMQDDRLVGKLPVKKGFYLKLIESRFEAGHLEVGLPREKFKEYFKSDRNHEEIDQMFVTFDEIKSKSKLELISPESLEFRVNITLEGRILEISDDLKIQDPKVVKLLEKEFASLIEKEIESVVEVFKENQVDPIGFGQIYNSQRPLKEKGEWREMIPDISVDAQVKTRIVRHGIIK